MRTSPGLGIRMGDTVLIAQKRGGEPPVPPTYTEYYVSDGIGGFEQANDVTVDPLFVRE
jgi:hypothetical protein